MWCLLGMWYFWIGIRVRTCNPFRAKQLSEGDHPNFRKNALGVKRPFSELSESCRVFLEQCSEFRNWFSWLEQYENHNSRSNSRSDSPELMGTKTKDFHLPLHSRSVFFKNWGGPGTVPAHKTLLGTCPNNRQSLASVLSGTIRVSAVPGEQVGKIKSTVNVGPPRPGVLLDPPFGSTPGRLITVPIAAKIHEK